MNPITEHKRPPWNKGLTKETSKSMRMVSEAQKGRGNSMYGRITWNMGHTLETDSRIKPSWNKGLTKMADERIRRVSELKVGRPRSEATKRKISTSKRGSVPWNRGLTKDVDERIERFSRKKAGKWYSNRLDKGEDTKSIIERVREIAEKRGGVCLSTKYVNAHTLSTWKCAKGHIWEASPNNVRRGSWCPHCAGRVKDTIDHMQMIAKHKGGECLSRDYGNNKTKLRWRCKEGHEWDAKPSHVLGGHWCPICSQGLGERICRNFFEIMFERGFPSRKPRWLMGLKGRRMELDGYCEELKLAFEYNGRQHYEFIPYIHHIIKKFLEQQERDRLKRDMCLREGVRLIIIPYTIPYKDMQAYILEECRRIGNTPVHLGQVDYKSFT